MSIAPRLARGRVYYGWYVVGVLFLSSFLSAGVNWNAPGFFIKPMTEELHWSRGFFSSVVYMGTLISIPLSMIVWPLVDRRGARTVMLVSGLLTGLGVAAQGFVHTQWQFLLLKSIILPFGTVGIGPMISMLVVSNWFVKQRGRAISWTTMGMSSAGFVLPSVITYLISTLGWRHAWVVLGLATAVLSVLSVWLFLERRPEDLGLLPDGASPDSAKAGAAASAAGNDGDWTRREVLRTPTFWFLALALPLGFLGWGVIRQHFVAYFTDPGVGMSVQAAARIMTTISIVSFASKMPWGFAMERLNTRNCLAISFALFASGIGLVVAGGSSTLVIVLGAIVIGMGFGGNLPLQGMIWVQYYGRGSQGMARSLANPVSAGAELLGPMLAGYVWDATGTYRLIFALYALTPLAAVFLIRFAVPPKRSVRSAESLEAKVTGS